MKRLITVAAAIAFVCTLSSNAHALTINDPGVVGARTFDTGEGNSPTDNLSYAQHLLDMAASTQDPTGCNLTTSTNCYVTSSTDYSGTLDNVTSSNTGTGTTIPTTYDYVLAKYDGTNAGYVLFYMPTYDGGSYTIPEYSYSIWNTTTGQGNPVQASYQLSGWVGFTVPDGGSTVTLLGSVLLGLSVLRRRLSKN